MKIEKCDICGNHKAECQKTEGNVWCNDCLMEYHALFKPYEPPNYTADRDCKDGHV